MRNLFIFLFDVFWITGFVVFFTLLTSALVGSDVGRHAFAFAPAQVNQPFLR